MMKSEVAVDVYAHTNPAFWALALSKFIAEYAATDVNGRRNPCPYPLLFLPMPLSFSSDARLCFNGTNKKTGLMTWLERNPSIRSIAATEILAAKDYSRRALTFALAHDLAITTDAWGYLPGSGTGWKKANWPARSDQRGAVLQACGRLGHWCAMVELPTVFIALGVRP